MSDSGFSTNKSVVVPIIVSVATSFLATRFIELPVQRQLRDESRKQDVRADANAVAFKYAQAIWNYWHGRKHVEPKEAMQEYRNQLQRATEEAASISVRLEDLYEDKTIVQDWRQMMQSFHDAHFPLGQGGMVDEVTMQHDVVSAMSLADSAIARMRDEVRR